MKIKSKTKLIGYTIGILLFIVMIAGVSYAMYRKTLYNVDVDAIAKNLDEYIIYSKGVNISSGTLNPVSSYNNGASATITFYKKSNTPYDIYGHIYLDINNITVPLSRELRYTVIDNSSSNVISEGSFYTYMSGDSILTAYNIPLSTSVSTYTVYIWLDEELYDLETASSSFDIDIRCYATMKPIDNDAINVSAPSVNNAANFVKYLYDSHSKSTATVNNITYNLAPSVNLMNDRHASMSTDINGGDIRFYGANPNNYVWLGDTYTSTYTFTSKGSNITRNVGDKKLWRIIGVFDGRLKLISNDPISGNTGLSWDTSENNTGGNSGYGINQWSESTYSDTGEVYPGADLMRLLNPGYEEESINNSLYWTKGTGTVYTGRSNATTSNISFANTGLSSAEQNMIDTATWYLGAYNGEASYVNTQYLAERQSTTLGKICSIGDYCNDKVVRTSTWTGKVGLMYPSDYGYATDLTTCSLILNSYESTLNSYACKAKDWLFDSSKSQWTLSPRAYPSYAYYVFGVSDVGRVHRGSANGVYVVRPAVYLKSGVSISEGNGSQSNPYVLSN